MKLRLVRRNYIILHLESYAARSSPIYSLFSPGQYKPDRKFMLVKYVCCMLSKQNSLPRAFLTGEYPGLINIRQCPL
jgi:hypothetical protein